MSLRIGKAEVRLSIGVLPLFAALIVIGEGKTLALSVLSLLLHECAHAIAARNLGYGIRRISVWPFGAVMHLERQCAEPGGEWIVSLAGPLSSLIAASCARLLCQALPQYAEGLDAFVHTNLALALLNLLPAYPLDGGRIAKSLFLRCVSERKARFLSLAFTFVIAVLLLAGGVYCMTIGMPMWTLLCIAPYLLISAWIEWKQVSPGTVAHVLDRRFAHRTGAAIRAQLIWIDGSATIGTAMQTLSNRFYTVLRIQSGERVFETDENALMEAASRYGYETTLKDAFMH